MQPKPFYKCLGGKSSLADAIIAQAPLAGTFKHYVEPFVGGGAVFFALYNAGFLDNVQVTLTDADPAVINTLLAVQRDPHPVYDRLETFRKDYAQLTPDARSALYYNIRNKWNSGVCPPEYHLFLRGLAFNGLWRTSKIGRMNSPWGKYAKFAAPSLEHLQAVHAALQGVELKARHFTQSFVYADPEAFMYVDPPYDGGFTAYTADGFSSGDQTQLIKLCAKHAGPVIYSNANTEFINGIVREYWPNSNTNYVQGRRSVSASADLRGTAPEVLIRG